MTPDGGHLCPSGCCEEGAMLLGVIGTDGVVGYISPSPTIDAEFVAEARRTGDPERRFRFSQPCVEGGCSQWTGTRCGVIDRVVQAGADAEYVSESSPPACGIRPACRWFAQEGVQACAVCPLVITDLRAAT